MKKFLICVWPFPSHFFPLIAIGHALRRRGAEVAFYTGASAHPLLKGEGFGCFGFEHIDEAQLDALFERQAFASGQHPLRFKALLREWLLGTLPGQIADLTPILEIWQPDVIISETSLWAPILIFNETHKLPVAVFSTVAGCMVPGPDAPPFGLGLPRPRNLQTRLLARVAQTIGDWMAADFRRAVNQLRATCGLVPLSISVTEFAGQMPLYLVPSIPEFDYQRRDLPRSVAYVGACLWNKPGGAPAPEWLAHLPRDRPVIHVTEGTFHSQTPFVLRAAAQGLANLSMHVIMTTGGKRDPAALNLGPIAPNVRVERWIAHSDLLPYTDVLVTTGGAGTVMAALHAGVPLVIIPTEWDKPENAQRVVEAGAGIRLAMRHCTPARLRSAVEHVLRDPAFRRNAQRLSLILSQHDGPAQAADLLEGLGDRQPIPEYVLS